MRTVLVHQNLFTFHSSKSAKRHSVPYLSFISSSKLVIYTVPHRSFISSSKSVVYVVPNWSFIILFHIVYLYRAPNWWLILFHIVRFCSSVKVLPPSVTNTQEVTQVPSWSSLQLRSGLAATRQEHPRSQIGSVVAIPAALLRSCRHAPQPYFLTHAWSSHVHEQARILRLTTQQEIRYPRNSRNLF